MSYNMQKIFEALGKGIARFNAFTTIKATLETNYTAWIPLIDDTDGERRLLNAAASANTSDQSLLDGMKAGIKDNLTNFILDEIRLDLAVVQKNLNQIIDALVDAMEDNSDTVLENTFDAVVPTYDNDNTGDGTIPVVNLTQQAHDDVNVELECYDIATEDEEKWHVRLSFRGGLSIIIGTATTATAFDTASQYALGITPIDWGFSFTIGAGSGGNKWAIGDKIYFSTSVDVAGNFQYFFTNEFHKALPSDSTPSETVDEDWAAESLPI